MMHSKSISALALRSAGLALACCLVASCGGTAAEPAEEAGDDPSTIVVNELRATIGPTGGSLDGGNEGPFAGFRLLIPAGALDKETEIVVRATVDPTPLALTAERVGPQYAIEPAGLVLSVPAELTVAFDPLLREQWDTPDSECRVWYRDGNGWSRAEQTASTADGVTVPLPALTTVAAGVFVGAKAPSCQVTGSCASTTGDQGCLAGSSFCLTRLAPPSVLPYEYNAITTRNGFAYFLTSPGTNQFAIAKYDLLSTNGATTSSIALNAPPTTTVSSRGRITPIVSSGVSVLSLVGYGNVFFRPSSPAVRYDSSSSYVPAGVGSGRFGGISRFVITNTNGLRALRDPDKSVPLINLSTTDTTATVTEIRLLTEVTSIFGSSSFAAVSNSSGIAPKPFLSGYSFHDPCGSSSTILSTVDVNEQHQAVACGNKTVFTSPTALPANPGHSVSSLAIDNGLYTFVVNGTMAQLTRIDMAGGIASVPLSTAEPGTADYNSMIPRAIRYEPNLDMLVLFTRGNNANGAPDIYLIEAFRN